MNPSYNGSTLGFEPRGLSSILKGFSNYYKHYNHS